MSDFRDFLDSNEIRRLITSSVNYRNEDVREARALLIFKTSPQETWLVAIPNRLYCALDDRRNPEARIQWSMPISEARTASIKTKGYRGKVGKLDIGEKRHWLYTRDLFHGTEVTDSVKRFISIV